MKNTVWYFIGLDVHKLSTYYAVRDRHGVIVCEGEASSIYSELFRRLEPYLFSSMIGLEATTTYYPLYQGFKQAGYDIRVGNTIHMRQVIGKNDKLDAARLAEMLRLESFPESYVPPQEIQNLRTLVRLRHSLMEERNKSNVRLQAVLSKNGVRLRANPFTKSWLAQLTECINTGKTGPEIKHELEHYTYLAHKVKDLNQEMIQSTQKHYPKELELITSIKGFGEVLSCYVAAEVLPIERFKSEKKLRRYAGVIPSFKESGGKTSRGHIPKGSSRPPLRWALVQAASTTANTKTKLGSYYHKKKKQKKSSKLAKIAVASSLTNIIYKVLTTKKPYNA
jgi:transposase